MWDGERWYEGTADAIFQNMHLVTLFDADRVCIFAADHIYKMDVEQMLAYHWTHNADVTVAAYVVPSSEASQFGCIATDETGRIIDFVEKPAVPPEIPGRPGFSYVSMGNYSFERETLEESVLSDSERKDSKTRLRPRHLPRLFGTHKLMAYDFSTNVLPGDDKPYGRTSESIKALLEAHMDLLRHESPLSLYNPQWPIRTVSYSDPPGFTYPDKDHSCSVDGCLRAEASRVLGAYVRKSVLSRNCIIHAGSVVEECIIGQGVRNRRGLPSAAASSSTRTTKIPAGTSIGFDPVADAERYHVDPARESSSSACRRYSSARRRTSPERTTLSRTPRISASNYGRTHNA